MINMIAIARYGLFHLKLGFRCAGSSIAKFVSFCCYGPLDPYPDFRAGDHPPLVPLETLIAAVPGLSPDDPQAVYKLLICTLRQTFAEGGMPAIEPILTDIREELLLHHPEDTAGTDAFLQEIREDLVASSM